MARRPKLTEKAIEDICTGIRLLATYDLACKYAGVGYSTFRDWMAQARNGKPGLPQKLAESVAKAEGDAAIKCLLIIQKAAPITWQAAAWLLERRYPEIYARRTAPENAPADADAIARAILKAQQEMDKSIADESDASLDTA